jgi:hypothetical protein
MNTYLCTIMMLMAYRLLIAADECSVIPYVVRMYDDGSIVAISSKSRTAHIIPQNYRCLLTDRLIKDYLDEACKQEKFFLLGAYSCGQADDYTYVDGKTLLARQLCVGGPRRFIDPISKHEIKRTAFFECSYNSDHLRIRGLGDVSQAKLKGTLLHNMTVYLLAKEAELALQSHGMLEQKLQEYDYSSLVSDDMCIANGQAAYHMEDLDRAYMWYRLADGSRFISAQSKKLLSDGCLNVALACGLEKRALAIPLLEKVLSLGCSNEAIGGIAGRLSELHQDRDKKLFWMKKSALAGSAKGMCNLGTLYQNSDIKKAIYWHKKAAENGARPGMIHLFCDIALESQGHGIEIDTLCDYANKLVKVFNKKYATDDQEEYVRNIFPKRSPQGYACALAMIREYATVPMLDEFV